MTLQLDVNGPGVETYRSTKYTASVNGTGVYVHGYSRTTEYVTVAWTTGTMIEASWLKYGTDEVTTASIALADATPITSAVVYPGHLGVVATVIGGICVLTGIPVNKRFRIEVNGDIAEPLYLFAEPLDDGVDESESLLWTDLALDVSSINYTTEEITFSGPHGLITGDRVVFQTDPGVGPSELEDLGLILYEPYLAVVTASNRVSLTTLAGAPVVFNEDGEYSLRFFAHRQRHDDTSLTLVFGPGVHVAGRTFDLTNGCSVYIARGAWVIGGFDFRNRDQLFLHGPGIISGEHAVHENILPKTWAERVSYSPICGFDDLNGYYPNAIRGVTLVASPFWTVAGGVWSARNVQVLGGWHSNSDAIEVVPHSPGNRRAEIVDCFCWAGDDNCRFFEWCHLSLSGCFLVNSASACLHGMYWAVSSDRIYYTTVDDMDLMNLAHPGVPVLTLGEGYGSNGYFVRTWADGYEDNRWRGHYHVTMTRIRTWGEHATCRLIAFENKSYPWGEPRDQYGQINDFVLRDWTISAVPAEISRIEGFDNLNTPCKIAFENITIAGEPLRATNFDTYFRATQNIYAITVNGKTVRNR